jgi:IclR family transcriptional regulator, KDG regulon repressor
MYNAPILKKALDILKLIVKENRPLSVTQISHVLSISKSTTFGILKSLEEEGFIYKDARSKKYTIGATLFELSRTILKSTDVTVAARPYLEKLMSLVDETVCLGINEGNEAVVVDVLDPTKDFKILSRVGTKFSLTSGVIGKVFLSSFTDTQVRQFLAEHGLKKYTDNSITDLETFLKELERTRQQGYAVDIEEYLKGVRAIGALVTAGYYPVAAVWIVGFSDSMNDSKLPKMIEHLKDAVDQISVRLSPFVSCDIEDSE